MRFVLEVNADGFIRRSLLLWQNRRGPRRLGKFLKIAGLHEVSALAEPDGRNSSDHHDCVGVPPFGSIGGSATDLRTVYMHERTSTE